MLVRKTVSFDHRIVPKSYAQAVGKFGRGGGDLAEKSAARYPDLPELGFKNDASWPMLWLVK